MGIYMTSSSHIGLVKAKSHCSMSTHVIRCQWGNQTISAIECPSSCQGVIIVEIHRHLERVEIKPVALLRERRGPTTLRHAKATYVTRNVRAGHRNYSFLTWALSKW